MGNSRKQAQTLSMAVEEETGASAGKASIRCCQRIEVSQPRLGDVGIDPHADIENVDWIWHPECAGDTPVFLEFSLTFETEDRSFEFEITADQRYELRINDRWIAAGPDNSDPAHWSFARYRADGGPGKVTIQVFAWWLGLKSPHARMSCRPGFAFAGCGAMFDMLSTGKAAWKVRKLESHQLKPQEDVEGRFIGDELLLDKTIKEGAWVSAVKVPVVKPRPHVGGHGIGWRLYPASMPDQISDSISTGTVRGVLPYAYDGGKPWPQAADAGHPEVESWQKLIEQCTELEVPRHTAVSVLWDFETYLCGYPLLSVAGGDRARIRWEWAESLYNHTEGLDKGVRGEVAGKYFRGFGDSFITNGEANDFRGHWWHSGRYVLLTIQTLDEPLRLRGVAIRKTGYPWQISAEFQSSDWDSEAVVDICMQGFLHCSHETFVDCPYYEQLMYVGDTRIEALIAYTQSGDDRLIRRAMELFDFSRSNHGFCSARFPSRNQVDILPFSLSWVWMLRDYLYWRDDFEWLRIRLPGMRSLMAAFETYEDSEGLLRDLPGWNFADWVDHWDDGRPPSHEGLSVLINMQYLQALLSASEVEGGIGCKSLSERYRKRARLLADRLKSKFWDFDKGYFIESDGVTAIQHSQIFALLSNLFDDEMEQAMLKALLDNPALAPATLFFRHYFFEVLKKCGRVDLLLRELDFWKELRSSGLCTPLERNEPSRSDCHAWSSHPLYHIHASILGIRPLVPGFRELVIEPFTETLGTIEARMPHPGGEIYFQQLRKGDLLHLRIQFPEGVKVNLHWQGKRYSDSSGLIEI